jgi:carbonic anhydrase/acetyltransferase-like protein (isoleucine patch superfamily)
MRSRPTRIVILVIGILAAVIGLVWIGQGSGLIPGSSMTGDRTWLGIGLVCLVAGAFAIFSATRKRA